MNVFETFGIRQINTLLTLNIDYLLKALFGFEVDRYEHPKAV